MGSAQCGIPFKRVFYTSVLDPVICQEHVLRSTVYNVSVTVIGGAS